MKRLLTVLLVLLVAAAMLTGCSGSGSKSGEVKFPTKVITIVAPSSPGSTMDLIARAMAPYSEKYLGQPMIVKNTVGGGFTIGTAEAVNGNPDGYTWCLTTNQQIGLVPYVLKGPYDVNKDIVALAATGECRWVLAVNSKTFGRVGASDLNGLLEYMKKNPDALKSGTSSATNMMLFKKLAGAGYGTKINSYKDNAELAVAVGNGEVDMAIASPNTLMALEKSGNIKIVMEIPGVPSDPFRKDVACVSASYPEIYKALGSSQKTWYVMMASSKIPPEVVAKMNKFIKDVMNDESFKEQLKKINVVPIYHSEQEVAEVTRAEFAESAQYFSGLAK